MTPSSWPVTQLIRHQPSFPAENLGANAVRFDLTYERDAGERTLRQASSSEPENAVLDMPWTAQNE